VVPFDHGFPLHCPCSLAKAFHVPEFEDRRTLLYRSEGKEGWIVTMVLVERETRLPLDLVVLINSFLYERLTDENFKQAIDLWFENKEECKWRFGHISNWNTSRVTNMERAFCERIDFNEDIRRWNVGRVTNMRFMFCFASHFNRDIGQWDVSSVTNMGGMFSETCQFNGEIGQWDVGSVADMSDMFSGAKQFNGDIGQWDVSSVTNMGCMFRGASQFDRDIGRWDVGNVTFMGLMFYREGNSTETLANGMLAT
jgi:surface protein